MNHDYAHCLDYNVDCPKECFRGQLVKDARENHPGIVVSWMSFKGTDECPKEDEHESSHISRHDGHSV